MQMSLVVHTFILFGMHLLVYGVHHIIRRRETPLCEEEPAIPTSVEKCYTQFFSTKLLGTREHLVCTKKQRKAPVPTKGYNSKHISCLQLFKKKGEIISSLPRARRVEQREANQEQFTNRYRIQNRHILFQSWKPH